MWNKIKTCIGEKEPVHRIYEILKHPLNRECRLELLTNYAKWHIYNKSFKRNALIKLQNGFISKVYPDSDSGVRNLFTRNVDFYENKFIRSVLNEGDFIIDAGCNVGNRTLVLADIIDGALLIDANGKCLERVKTNFQMNGISISNYHMVQKAAGSKRRKIFFTDLGGTCCQNKIVEDESSNVKVSEVEMTTVDYEMERIGNPPCSFIKTDLEGFDLDALLGATRTLKNGNMKLIKFERFPEISLELFRSFFQDLNFRLFTLNSVGLPSTEDHILASASNLFAIPEKYCGHFIPNN